MSKISVIVPVYNAEEFLEKSISSVLNQTIYNLELILIDDGSKDSSGIICDSFAAKDVRVKVIHKKNEGVSIARNAGIDMATGEFIGFVDSDDWIEPDMFEKMLKEAKSTHSDIVMCDTTTVYSDGRRETDTITQLSENVILMKKDLTPELLLEVAGSACRCIYSQKLIKSWDLHFPYGIRFSEDRIFNILAMGYANQISYIKASFYNRFMNIKSAVHRFHPDYFDAIKLSAQETEKVIKAAWDDENYQIAYLSQFINGALMAINNYYYKTSTFTAKERKAVVKNICNDEELRSAIKKSGYGGKQGKWIINKNLSLLIMYAKLANWKHGR